MCEHPRDPHADQDMRLRPALAWATCKRGMSKPIIPASARCIRWVLSNLQLSSSHSPHSATMQGGANVRHSPLPVRGGVAALTALPQVVLLPRAAWSPAVVWMHPPPPSRPISQQHLLCDPTAAKACRGMIAGQVATMLQPIQTRRTSDSISRQAAIRGHGQDPYPPAGERIASYHEQGPT